MSEEESLINEDKRLRTVEIAMRMIESGNVALYDIAYYTELPLSKDGSIVSPVRCKWEPAEK